MKLMPETLDEWLFYIQSIHFRSLDLDLGRVRRVKHILRLHHRPTIITVAGTNGKGSSVAILESILQHSGRVVGTFTSPHLLKYHERIRISGDEISEDKLVRAFATVEIARGEIPLTFFEFGTIAALLLFQEAQVELAVLEVGLGGRLDAVNTEVQDITLLTPISMDHEKWLGSTREKIGKEKAGILKFGGKVVINDYEPPGSVIDRARLLGCQFIRAGVDYVWKADGDRWNWKPIGESWNSVETAKFENQLPVPLLPGEHQLMNAAGVVAVLSLLDRHLPISRLNLEKGMRSQALRGRLETYTGPPEIIVDVAHNIAAAKCLQTFLANSPIPGRTFAVFSALKDKAVAEIVRIFLGVIDKWYLTELTDERALSIQHLEETVASVGISDRVSINPPESAFLAARQEAALADRIIVFGSTYLAGVILKFLDNERPHA